jgi:hypothetical protein
MTLGVSVAAEVASLIPLAMVLDMLQISSVIVPTY